MLGRQEPQAKALVLVRPTKSRVLFAQMVGRGTRRHPGKQDCLVLDLIGAGERHARSFAWACGYGRHAGLYALPAGDRARVALQQVADRWRVWHTEGREQRLVTDGLDLEYAQGVAEELARRMGAVVLARRGAPWRRARTSCVR